MQTGVRSAAWTSCHCTDSSLQAMGSDKGPDMSNLWQDEACQLAVHDTPTSWLPAGQMLCRVCAPPAQCLVAGPLICAKLGRPIGFMLRELAQAQQRLVLPWARQALVFRVRRGTPGGICRAEHTNVSHVAQASGYEGSQGSNLE